MLYPENAEFSFGKNNSQLSFSSGEFFNDEDAAKKLVADENEFNKENIISQHVNPDIFNNQMMGLPESWSFHSHLSLSSNIGSNSFNTPVKKRLSIGDYFADTLEPVGELGSADGERLTFGKPIESPKRVEEPISHFLDFSQNSNDNDNTLRQAEQSDTSGTNSIDVYDEYVDNNAYSDESYQDLYAFGNNRKLSTIAELSQEVDITLSYRDSNGSYTTKNNKFNNQSDGLKMVMDKSDWSQSLQSKNSNQWELFKFIMDKSDLSCPKPAINSSQLEGLKIKMDKSDLSNLLNSKDSNQSGGLKLDANNSEMPYHLHSKNSNQWDVINSKSHQSKSTSSLNEKYPLKPINLQCNASQFLNENHHDDNVNLSNLYGLKNATMAVNCNTNNSNYKMNDEVNNYIDFTGNKTALSCKDNNLYEIPRQINFKGANNTNINGKENKIVGCYDVSLNDNEKKFRDNYRDMVNKNIIVNGLNVSNKCIVSNDEIVSFSNKQLKDSDININTLNDTMVNVNEKYSKGSHINGNNKQIKTTDLTADVKEKPVNFSGHISQNKAYDNNFFPIVAKSSIGNCLDEIEPANKPRNYKKTSISLSPPSLAEDVCDIGEFLKSTSTPIKSLDYRDCPDVEYDLEQLAINDRESLLRHAVDSSDGAKVCSGDVQLCRAEVMKKGDGKAFDCCADVRCGDGGCAEHRVDDNTLDKFLDSRFCNSFISSFEVLPDAFRRKGCVGSDLTRLRLPQVDKHKEVKAINWIEVTSSLIFEEVCCVGLSVTKELQVTNLSPHLIKLLFVVVNSNTKSRVSFHAPNHALLEKYATEKIKVVFTPQSEGRHEEQMLLQQVVLSYNKMRDNKFDNFSDAEGVVNQGVTVDVKGWAERPLLKILCDGTSIVDGTLNFGEVPLRSSSGKLITIVNMSRAALPLVLSIESDSSSHLCFQIISGAAANKNTSFIISKCKSILNVFLLGRCGDSEPRDSFEFILQLKAPSTNKGEAYKLKSKLNVFLNQISLHHLSLVAINLIAIVGLAKIAVKSRNLVLGFDSNNVSKDVLLQNNGQIDLVINCKLEMDFFKVDPLNFVLSKNEEKMIQVNFIKLFYDQKVLSRLLLQTQYNGPTYEIKLTFEPTFVNQMNLNEPVVSRNLMKVGLVEVWPSVVYFSATKINKSQISKVDFRNKSTSTIEFEVKLPNPPFIIQHERFSTKSQRYTRIPIIFSPSHLGTYTSDVIFKGCVTDHSSGEVCSSGVSSAYSNGGRNTNSSASKCGDCYFFTVQLIAECIP